MQVPLAVAADVIFTRPRWMQSAGSAVLTLLGGAVVLAGFVGISLGDAASQAATLAPEEHEWEAAQEWLQSEVAEPEDWPASPQQAQQQAQQQRQQQLGSLAASKLPGDPGG